VVGNQSGSKGKWGEKVKRHTHTITKDLEERKRFPVLHKFVLAKGKWSQCNTVDIASSFYKNNTKNPAVEMVFQMPCSEAPGW
jgi:hypothetical protein